MAHNIKNPEHESRVTSHEARAEAVTLIEMLIVIGVIAILASMVIAIVTRVDNQGKERNLLSTFLLLETALNEYRDQTGTFPVPVDIELLPNPIDRSEFLYRELYLIPSARKILTKISNTYIADRDNDSLFEIYDPWTTVLDYIYVLGDNFPLIISAGADKLFNTADDIDNR